METIESLPFDIAKKYFHSESISSINKINTGLINSTYVVNVNTTYEDSYYILQKMNINVFKKPLDIISNLRTIGHYISTNKNKLSPVLCLNEWQVPLLRKPLNSNNDFIEDSSGFWRLTTYITNTKTVTSISTDLEAYQLGLGLAKFHYLVRDIPLDKLKVVIPNFHCTPIYLQEYDNFLTHNKSYFKYTTEIAGRIDKLNKFIDLRRDYVNLFTDSTINYKLSKIPIHGDPKVNNFLFDLGTDRALALIDLDTVQPGYIILDIADCLRSCCNQMGEECLYLDLVTFNIGLFESFIEGYYSFPLNPLNHEEILYIPYALRLITYELGLRFFYDYLSGDRYFKTLSPENNLLRAEVQFQLLHSIESNFDQIYNFITKYLNSI